MLDDLRYIHNEAIHNFMAAKEVVPFIIDLLNPKSVADIGCGTGTWLKIFQDEGVENLLGIDGHYVDKNLLKIDLEKFVDFDLERLYISETKFELAISLEVAEHLSVESADIFIQTLTSFSDTIIFSAAIPNQGGQNHINEQEPKYWIRKFEDNGFKVFDILRPVFWENENIDSWYRQNILLFTNRKDLFKRFESYDDFKGKLLVHPVLAYEKDVARDHYKIQIDKIFSGKKNITFYFKLLFKAFKRKFT